MIMREWGFRRESGTVGNLASSQQQVDKAESNTDGPVVRAFVNQRTFFTPVCPPLPPMSPPPPQFQFWHWVELMRTI